MYWRTTAASCEWNRRPVLPWTSANQQKSGTRSVGQTIDQTLGMGYLPLPDQAKAPNVWVNTDGRQAYTLPFGNAANSSNGTAPPQYPGAPRPLLWSIMANAGPHTSHFIWDDWIRQTKDSPLWHVPISVSSDPGLEALLNNLHPEQTASFRRVFHGDPWGPMRCVTPSWSFCRG